MKNAWSSKQFSARILFNLPSTIFSANFGSFFADLDSSLDEGLILSLYQDYDRTRLLGQISYTDTDDYFDRFLDVDVRSYEGASQFQFLFQKNEDGTYRFLKFERIS